VLFADDFHMTIEPRAGSGTRVRIQIPELHDPAAGRAGAASVQAQPSREVQPAGAATQVSR
jgi:hypothetical protein